MGPTVTMYIPAFLRYDLRETNGEWLIGALRAYWELPAMMVQFLRSGGRGAPAVDLCRGLLRNQGWRGSAGFMAGFRRVGAPHQRLVRRFLDAVAAGDKFAAAQALSSTAAITLGDRDPIELAELAEQLAGRASPR